MFEEWCGCCQAPGHQAPGNNGMYWYLDTSWMEETIETAESGCELATRRAVRAGYGVWWLEVKNSKRDCVRTTRARGASRCSETQCVLKHRTWRSSTASSASSGAVQGTTFCPFRPDPADAGGQQRHRSVKSRYRRVTAACARRRGVLETR